MKQNSFGYGGANAHAILDSAQSYLGDRYQSIPGLIESETQLPKRYYLLPFSAHNKTALKRNIEAFSSSELGDTHLPSLAYTLGSRRSNHSDRAFTVVASDSTGIQISSELATDKLTFGTAIGARPELAFVFTGQGAQWAQMGLELVERYEVVRSVLNELDETLAGLPNAPNWSLLQALAQPKEKSRMNEAEFSQALTTAIQIAIVDLLKSWGVSPTAVVGHSSGM